VLVAPAVAAAGVGVAAGADPWAGVVVAAVLSLQPDPQHRSQATQQPQHLAAGQNPAYRRVVVLFVNGLRHVWLLILGRAAFAVQPTARLFTVKR
jgi:hypothetical protein